MTGANSNLLVNYKQMYSLVLVELAKESVQKLAIVVDTGVQILCRFQFSYTFFQKSLGRLLSCLFGFCRKLGQPKLLVK